MRTKPQPAENLLYGKFEEVVDAIVDGPKAEKGATLKKGQHASTPARQHASTPARQHASTPARQHASTQEA